jgi:hypothetical protein
LKITVLAHANTSGVAGGGEGAIALLSLGYASRPIRLKLFAV